MKGGAMAVNSPPLPWRSPAVRLRRPSTAISAAINRHPRRNPTAPATSLSLPFQPRVPFQYQSKKLDPPSDDDDEDTAIGDCLVFEEGAFELGEEAPAEVTGKMKAKTIVEAENLVPEKWRGLQEEINMTKKEKRKISWELKFGSKLERRKKLPLPDLDEYRAYRDQKLSQLKPIVLDRPKEFPPIPSTPDPDSPQGGSGSRGEAKNPRSLIENAGLDSISDFFNSDQYVPEENGDDKKPAKRKLFTAEEKILLNKRVPVLADATSSKWLPVHALAASGEFYLLDALLKHNVDLNDSNKDGMCAIHRAILGNKVAIVNYLLRESANPFVKDRDGATLLHYAVLAASTPIIKTLLLYDLDINLADDEGWTPLHLAVQTLRSDVMKLLLVRGADRAATTQEGLTPLDLCLLSGHNSRTFELIKLLKEPPRLKPI